MNSKDKKITLYKELIQRSEINYKAQKALGYKLLDNPIKHGYNCHSKLRSDIARRDDVKILEFILKKFGKNVWCKNKDFKKWDFSLKCYDDIVPYIIDVDEEKYLSFILEVQKWFEYAGKHKDTIRWAGVVKWYTCKIPEYFFKKVITVNYKTHYKVIDEVLLQEESYINDRLDWEFHGKRWGKQGAPKWYRNVFHQREKNKCKSAINRALKTREYEDIEKIPIDGRHRHCADWYWY